MLRLLQQVALMEIEEEDIMFANYLLNRRALRPGKTRRYLVNPGYPEGSSLASMTYW